VGQFSRQWLGAMPSGMVAGLATAASSRHEAAPPGSPHQRLPGFPQHAVEVSLVKVFLVKVFLVEFFLVEFSQVLSQPLRGGFITSTGTAART
jgi:hypothetical protein